MEMTSSNSCVIRISDILDESREIWPYGKLVEQCENVWVAIRHRDNVKGGGSKLGVMQNT